MKKWIRSYDWWVVLGCLLTYVSITTLIGSFFSVSNTTLTLTLLSVGIISVATIIICRKKLVCGAKAGYLVFLLLIGNVVCSISWTMMRRKTEINL
ncbi:MAG: hypothetical protein WC242_02090 [Candidatus Paceibacterota bacterium]